MSIPDWNSLDSVRHAHSELEAVALVFFGLLVLFDVLAHLSKDENRKTLLEKISLGFFAVAVLVEIVAYPYGQRNDTLSEQVIGSLDAKAREASTNASNALVKSGDAKDKSGRAKSEADAASLKAQQVDAELIEAEYLMSARQVQNRDELANKIKQQFKSRDVVLRSYIGDHEGWGLCTQLWYVAKTAEMNPLDQCGTAQLEVPLTSPFAISGPDVNETVKLGELINRIGRIGGWSALKAPVLTIFVGAKSPFIIGQARGVKIPTKKQREKNMKQSP